MGKKKLDLFNYYHLLDDISKLKNQYIKKNGNKKSETELISKIKSLEKVYLTNNICESIHSHISKYIDNKNISKKLFKDTLYYIINHYKYNLRKCIRRVFITRTLIIIIDKYKMNENPQIITYETFKKELEITISIMTDITNIKVVDETINFIDELDNDDIKNENLITENNDNSMSFSYESDSNDLFSIYNNEYFEDLNLNIVNENKILDIISDKNNNQNQNLSENIEKNNKNNIL